jgi:pimeloyl-ACP methyl ester carboxylesterase
MRGAGRSTVYPDQQSYSSAAMADDVASLLEALDLGPAHVVGHSLGSCIAQQLAILHPDALATAQLHATWALRDRLKTTMESLPHRHRRHDQRRCSLCLSGPVTAGPAGTPFPRSSAGSGRPGARP